MTVHVDPEDDEQAPTCEGLPLRSKAVAMLDQAWADVDCLKDQKRLLLHYLAGHIHVQVFFPLGCYRGEEQAAALRARLQQGLEPLEAFSRVEVFYG